MEKLKAFFKLESAGGILLFLVAVLAVIIENSSFSPYYDHLRDVTFTVGLGSLKLSKPLLLWVNDGLMAIFFLLVGLELKREVLEGHLSSLNQVMLPMVAALGGIVAPACIYWAINAGTPETLKGWAIPAATDIAFALGVLSLFGRRVPISLKIFLTALAIFDDIAAILIIALFYTSKLSTLALSIGGFALVSLYCLNRLGVLSLVPYFLIGVILWVAVLKSGVHATLAGVALALTIPHNSNDDGPLLRLEHALHPWVAYGVLPIFAFYNAGVNLSGITLSALLHPLTLGVAAGLFFGKQVGAFGASFLTIQFKKASLPDGSSLGSLYAICVLSGIGFTMSLFIGTLAFSSSDELTLVRLGVILGSLISGAFASLLLHLSLPREEDV